MGELTYDMNTGNFSVSIGLNDLSCNKSSIDTGGEGIYVNYPTDLTSVNWSQWGVDWSQLVCNDNAIAASNLTQKFDFTGEYYHLPTIFGIKGIKKVDINKRFYI